MSHLFTNQTTIQALEATVQYLSILSERLEKHTHDILLAHFEEHHPISTQQWGLLVELPLELYWMLQTSGLESWNRVETSAL